MADPNQPVSTATEVKTVIAAEKIVETIPRSLVIIGVNGVISFVLAVLRILDEKGIIQLKQLALFDTQTVVDLSSATSDFILAALVVIEAFRAWRRTQTAIAPINQPKETPNA